MYWCSAQCGVRVLDQVASQYVKDGQEVSWKNEMLEWTLHEWLVVSLSATAIFIALLAWRIPRQNEDISSREVIRFNLYTRQKFPTIHANNGIPTLQQLLDGIEVDPRGLGVSERLYEAGLAQFNHYVNNRDRVIKTSRGEMIKLANCLSQAEVTSAEDIGISMAMDSDDDRWEALRTRYDYLPPQGQIYAQHKRQEIDALRRIARDLERNVPRTDYTSVKARIASGSATLDSVMSELPIPWQDLRTINNRVDRPVPRGRPPKRYYIHVRFMLQEKGLLEDKYAERDGEWIVSNKHGLMVPYQEPVSRYEHIEEGQPPMKKGNIVVYTQNPSSEWDTEYWRQGGRLDQMYIRVRNGTSPAQLRSAHRRRIIKTVGWTLASLAALADIALIMAIFL